MATATPQELVSAWNREARCRQHWASNTSSKAIITSEPTLSSHHLIASQLSYHPCIRTLKWDRLHHWIYIHVTSTIAIYHMYITCRQHVNSNKDEWYVTEMKMEPEIEPIFSQCRTACTSTSSFVSSIATCLSHIVTHLSTGPVPWSSNDVAHPLIIQQLHVNDHALQLTPPFIEIVLSTYRSRCCMDLLISFIASANTSLRSSHLLRPFPECFVDTKQQQQQQQQQQRMVLNDAIKHMPSMSNITRTSMNNTSSSATQLLSWFLSSHCSLSMRLVQPDLYAFDADHQSPSSTSTSHDPSQRLPDYQFDVDIEDPEFDDKIQEHGMIVAFHGSPLENWHSIMRNGLVSKSGTKDERSGAIFGAGIYLSDDLRLARQFSSLGHGWSQSLLGSRLEVVGLYHLVNDPEHVHCQREQKVMEKKKGAREDVPERYYIVTDSSYLRLRSLLVWRVPGTAASEHRRWIWLILFYGIILLAIVMSQMDMMKLKKNGTRMMMQAARVLQGG